MLLWDTSALKGFKTGWLMHVSQTRCIVLRGWTDFCPKALSLHFAMKPKAKWGETADLIDFYKKRVCFGILLLPSSFITQNVLCGWIEICSGWMSFVIGIERRKGQELLLWTLFPLQGVTCLWSRRYLVVGAGECKIRYNPGYFLSFIRIVLTGHNLIFRLKRNFKDRWNYTAKILVSLAYALRLASFGWELRGTPWSAERVVQV